VLESGVSNDISVSNTRNLLRYFDHLSLS